ncbi:hypothetical protein [Psychrobacillus sp. NPDC096623]|uniref:hypothetical protein n=1 Tax=Psychrobacillus sp. NPDC096623 TaxID=3364492 RepID=UPI00382C8BCD
MELTKNQKYRNVLIYLLIVVFGLVTYSFDLYPGGHQLDLFSDEQSFTLTKKEILNSEHYKIERTDESILKVLLIDNEISFLKGLWLMGISLYAFWFINLSNLLKNKKIKTAIITSTIYTIIFVIAIFVYMERLNFMKSVIEELIG